MTEPRTSCPQIRPSELKGALPDSRILAALEDSIPSRALRITRGEMIVSARLAAAASKSNTPAWVYFVRCGNRIKIGAARDVGRRLRGLQTGSAFHLLLVGLIANGDERAIQERFDSLRVRAEWFLDHPALREFIAAEGWRP